MTLGDVQPSMQMWSFPGMFYNATLVRIMRLFNTTFKCAP